MKRDFDLIRAILRRVQAQPAGQPLRDPVFPDRDHNTVVEHIEIMGDANLLLYEIYRDVAGSVNISIQRLTWAGHDFLDLAADDVMWKQTKKYGFGFPGVQRPPLP